MTVFHFMLSSLFCVNYIAVKEIYDSVLKEYLYIMIKHGVMCNSRKYIVFKVFEKYLKVFVGITFQEAD